ncbi:putative transcriptional regulator [Arthrobacter sp. GAS37]|uniref:winged helix-turn-helix domain-containing protein n=1 Tax=Arthrobacter sp. GAS37 TaxID=3156261 RepID=UPI0038374C1E
MAIMPKMVRPDSEFDSEWSDALEMAIQCFGSGPKDMVVSYLRQNPASFRSEIAEGTGLKAGTLQNQIDDLLEWGVIDSDIPTDKRGRGRASRYSVNRERVLVMLETMKEYLLGRDSES